MRMPIRGNNVASLAQPRGVYFFAGPSLGTDQTKTLHEFDVIMFLEEREIKKSFTVNLLTIVNYPSRCSEYKAVLHVRVYSTSFLRSTS
jgi:hypothetical protein